MLCWRKQWRPLVVPSPTLHLTHTSQSRPVPPRPFPLSPSKTQPSIRLLLLLHGRKCKTFPSFSVSLCLCIHVFSYLTYVSEAILEWTLLVKIQGGKKARFQNDRYFWLQKCVIIKKKWMETQEANNQNKTLEKINTIFRHPIPPQPPQLHHLRHISEISRSVRWAGVLETRIYLRKKYCPCVELTCLYTIQVRS